MKKSFIVVATTLLIFFSLISGTHAVKSASELIVVPDDCPTIQAAINAAVDGDALLIKAGVYSENVNVNKSIALTGENTNATKISAPIVFNPLDFLGQGNTAIHVTADNVTVANLTISNDNAMGLGISTSGSRTHIIGNNVSAKIAINTNGLSTKIDENTISGYFTGIGLGAANTNSIISNNNIVFSHSYGIECEGSNFNVIYRNIIRVTSGYGVFIRGDNNNVKQNTITAASDGISISGGFYNAISDNLVVNCSNAGLRIDRDTNNTFSGNLVTETTYGVSIGDAAHNNTFYQNNFLNNVQQVDAANVTNFWDNGKEGNYWSDYLTKYANASEADSTGVGNTPYVIDSNNVDHYPLVKAFNTTRVSPAPTLTPSPTVPEFPSWIILPLIVVGSLVYLAKRKGVK